MQTAVIHFSDKSTLTLHEGDNIVPIIRVTFSDDDFTSMSKSEKIWEHTQNGLIPSIMDAFRNCNFFYLNNDMDVVYCVNSIVKIELV